MFDWYYSGVSAKFEIFSMRTSPIPESAVSVLDKLFTELENLGHRMHQDVSHTRALYLELVLLASGIEILNRVQSLRHNDAEKAADILVGLRITDRVGRKTI